MALRKPLFLNSSAQPDAWLPEEMAATDSLELGSLTMSGTIDMGNFKITNMADGTANSDPATYGQVLAALGGRDAKDNVVALADTNVAVAGTTTIDGVAVVVGNRVLLTNQTVPAENGIWVVQSGAWTRPSDYSVGSSAEGSSVFVTAGTNYEGTGWVALADAPSDVVGTNNPQFTRFTSPTYTAGNGIEFIGNAIAVDLAATNPGLQFSGGDLAVLLKDATLGVDNAGIFVQGLPSLFTVNGIATSANVTAANLNTLTGGGQTNLHSHANPSALGLTATANESIAIGDPIEWSGTANEVRQCRANSNARVDCFAVATSAGAAAASVNIIRRGIATGVLSGAAAGDRYYVGASGGLTTTPPNGTGNNIILVGTAVNATDLEVNPQYIGRKA